MKAKLQYLAITLGITFLQMFFGWTYALSADVESEGLRILRIGTIKVLSGLPTYVAVENRFFEQNGFKPIVFAYRSSDLAFNALKAGAIDLVGVAGTSQCLEIAEEKPNTVKIIGILYSSTCIVGRIGSNITNLDELKKSKKCTIGVFPGSVFQTYSRNALKSIGVNITDMDFIPYPPGLQANALDDGKIEVLYSLEPYCAIATGNGSGKYLTDEDLFAKAFLDAKKFPGGVVAINFNSFKESEINRIISAYNMAMAEIGREGFSKDIYLNRYTDMHSAFFAHVKFEGAAFGKDIHKESITILVKRLNEWGLLAGKIDMDSLIVK